MLVFNRLLFLTFLVLLLAAAGCSQPKPSYGVVEGVVTMDGKPLSDVEVVFTPDPEKGTKGRRSVALTDKSGHYRIASDDGKEGAVVGFHRVVVNDVLLPKLGSAPVVAAPEDTKGGAVGVKGPTTPAPPDQKKLRFPEDYSDMLKTPFKDIEVKAGTQTIDLKLKR